MGRHPGLDLSEGAIVARLQEMSLRSDLAPATRLDAKINMSGESILQRLREVSSLLMLCRAMAASTPAADPAPANPHAPRQGVLG